ncbi:MAG: flagellar basal body rod protein FlgC [Pseudomonadota bacterium]
MTEVDLAKIMAIPASGMQVQAERLKIIAQNIANADSTSSVPGGEPYRRKTITFSEIFDHELNATKVAVSEIDLDASPFKKIFEPNHPAADGQGYVLYPNVTTMVESLDSDEAQRSYEANIRAIEVIKEMLSATLALIE